MRRLTLLLFAMWTATLPQAIAAPFIPSADGQVLERLPTRASDPRTRELNEWRRELSRHPQNLDLAMRVARRYYEWVAAEGDPRYIGYAQAALGPWWDKPDPPVPVRVMRAILRQFNHQFDEAVSDLSAAVATEPSNGEAWSWLAAIAMVQARYPDARQACERMVSQSSPLIAVACMASVDAATGRADGAIAALRAALDRDADASPAEKLWALTRLAEIAERRGEHAVAEGAFAKAQALGLTDGYLLAAHADFLLDRGRANEVLSLLKGRERSDLLLLRLALAAKASAAPALADWTRTLAARFDAARLRGDNVHQKEEARFALAILGQTERALELARANFAVQREPADARIVLEAALAARQPKAAEPVLQWMQRSGIESVVLRALAARIEGVR